MIESLDPVIKREVDSLESRAYLAITSSLEDAGIVATLEFATDDGGLRVVVTGPPELHAWRDTFGPSFGAMRISLRNPGK